MGIPAARASTAGQSAMACGTVKLACDLKLGSLKPRRYRASAGMVAPSDPLPQIIGTYSTRGSPPGLWAAQLYHHETPGEEAVGANAAEGAALAAMPRLHGALAASAPASHAASTPASSAASTPVYAASAALR